MAELDDQTMCQPIFADKSMTMLKSIQCDDRNKLEVVGSSSCSSTTITSSSNQNKARLALLCVSALYGTNFGCVKVLDEAMSPAMAAALRFSLAAAAFVPLGLSTQFDCDERKAQIIESGVLAGVFCFIGYLGQALSLLSTDASVCAFICSLAVVVVPIIDLMRSSAEVVTGAPPQKKSKLGSAMPPALLAVAGVGLLELGGAHSPGIGDLLALLQPIFFGACFWKVEQTMKKADPIYATGEAHYLTVIMLSTVAICSIAWAMLSEGGASAMATDAWGIFASGGRGLILAALVWTGVVTTGFTTLVENAAMVHLSAAESTVIYSTEPLWAAAFASVALGEHLGLNTALGALFIISACLWSTFEVLYACIIYLRLPCVVIFSFLLLFHSSFLTFFFPFYNKIGENSRGSDRGGSLAHRSWANCGCIK
jgi:drug/metabolite transporter (DMT)-like permease